LPTPFSKKPSIFFQILDAARPNRLAASSISSQKSIKITQTLFTRPQTRKIAVPFGGNFLPPPFSTARFPLQ